MGSGASAPQQLPAALEAASAKEMTEVLQSLEPDQLARLKAALDCAAAPRVFVMHGSWPRVPAKLDDPATCQWGIDLKKALEAKGAKMIPDMEPTGGDKDYEEHIKHIADIVGEPDENTYFIAMSMGNHVTMRYIQSLAGKGKKVGGYVALGGWFESPLPADKLGPPFSTLTDRTTIDGAKIRAVCPKMKLIVGPRDPLAAPNSGGQEGNIGHWRSVFGDDLDVLQVDLIGDAKDEGKSDMIPGIPDLLLRDHYMGIEKLDQKVVDAVTALIFT